MLIPEHGRLRRSEASVYLFEKHGVPASKKTLDKLAVVGGGPLMTYAGRIPLYHVDDLDRWALSRLSSPVASTTERKSA